MNRAVSSYIRTSRVNPGNSVSNGMLTVHSVSTMVVSVTLHVLHFKRHLPTFLSPASFLALVPAFCMTVISTSETFFEQKEI